MDFKKNAKTDFEDVGDLSKKEAKKEVEALREGIDYHDYRHYVKNDAFPEPRSESSPTRRARIRWS